MDRTQSEDNKKVNDFLLVTPIYIVETIVIASKTNPTTDKK